MIYSVTADICRRPRRRSRILKLVRNETKTKLIIIDLFQSNHKRRGDGMDDDDDDML